MSTTSSQDDRRLQQRALAVVDEALERPPAVRDAFLAERCGDDMKLLESARQLLDACLRAEVDDVFMSGPVGEFVEPMLREVDAHERASEEASLPAVRATLAGRYEFVREIGRGGMAVVHLARDLHGSQDVAIKIIRQIHADSSQRVRFLHEVSIAARLAHPLIVSCIDSGDANGTLYYIMPFVRGESLRQRLDRDTMLSVADTIAIARDVAIALDHAHAHGVVHRDVKPQNVLLSDGRALVTDFGIALIHEAERITGSGMVVGTPMYMSPEQGVAGDAIDMRSDVYSLACVVFEMLAGEVPFPGASSAAVIAKHQRATVPEIGIIRPDLGSGVQSVLEKGLAKAPADRFGTASAFVDALRHADSAGEPT